jgi:flagellar biosynthetic protein FliR
LVFTGIVEKGIFRCLAIIIFVIILQFYFQHERLMDWYQYIDTSRVLVFTLVLTRISGIVIMSPVIGGSEIPVQVRALFVFTLTLLIMPSQWFVTITEPKNLTAYAILIAAELGIGLSLGLGLNLFFMGASMAGELIGQIGGLTASQIFDPISGDQTPLLSRMFQYLAITVFAAVGGLHVLVTSLLDTFQTLPPGEAAFQPTIAYSLVMILGLSFNLSIRIAAPVMVAVLVAMLVMGLLGKTLPQLNLMSVGFGINSVIMFAVMALSIGAGIWCFQERIDDVFQLLFSGLHAGIEP